MFDRSLFHQIRHTSWFLFAWAFMLLVPMGMGACPSGMTETGSCLFGMCMLGSICDPEGVSCCKFTQTQTPTLPSLALPSSNCPAGSMIAGVCLGGTCLLPGTSCDAAKVYCCSAALPTLSSLPALPTSNPFGESCPSGSSIMGLCFAGSCLLPGQVCGPSGVFCCSGAKPSAGPVTTRSSENCAPGGNIAGVCVFGTCLLPDTECGPSGVFCCSKPKPTGPTTTKSTEYCEPGGTILGLCLSGACLLPGTVCGPSGVFCCTKPPTTPALSTTVAISSTSPTATMPSTQSSTKSSSNTTLSSPSTPIPTPTSTPTAASSAVPQCPPGSVYVGECLQGACPAPDNFCDTTNSICCATLPSTTPPTLPSTHKTTF